MRGYLRPMGRQYSLGSTGLQGLLTWVFCFVILLDAVQRPVSAVQQFKRFWLLQTEVTRDQASQLCADQSAQLASIESYWQFELAMAAALSYPVWISLSDQLVEGEYTWLDSGNRLVQRITPLLPKDAETCANCIFMDSQGQFVPDNCGKSKRFALCEILVPEANVYELNAISVHHYQGIICILTQLRTVRCLGESLGAPIEEDDPDTETSLLRRTLQTELGLDPLDSPQALTMARLLNESTTGNATESPQVATFAPSSALSVPSRKPTKQPTKKPTRFPTVRPTSFPTSLLQEAPYEIDALTDIAEMEVGQTHGCARAMNGSVFCWGTTSLGQTGDMSQIIQRVPKLVQGLPTVTKLAVGGGHNCAFAQGENAVYCWGSNLHQQLGQPLPTISTVPLLVNLTTSLTTNDYTVTDLTAGGNHTCVLIRVTSTNETQAVCFGSNTKRQCADENSTSSAPSSVLFGLSFSSIYSGSDNNCVVRTAGDQTPFCWGGTERKRLFQDITTQFPPAEVKLKDSARSILSIALGQAVTCTLTIDFETARRVVRCVGTNSFGALGRGINDETARDVISAPVSMTGSTAVGLGGKGNTMCFIIEDTRSVRCWGRDSTLFAIERPALGRTTGAKILPLLDKSRPSANESVFFGCVPGCPFVDSTEIDSAPCLCSLPTFNISILGSFPTISLDYIPPRAFNMSLKVSEPWLEPDRTQMGLVETDEPVTLQMTVNLTQFWETFQKDALEAATSPKVVYSRLKVFAENEPDVFAPPLMADTFIRFIVDDADWPCPYGSFRNDSRCELCPAGTYEQWQPLPKQDETKCEQIPCNTTSHLCPQGAVNGTIQNGLRNSMRYCRLPVFKSQIKEPMAFRGSKMLRLLNAESPDLCAMSKLIVSFPNQKSQLLPSWLDVSCGGDRLVIANTTKGETLLAAINWTMDGVRTAMRSNVLLDLVPEWFVVIPESIQLGFVRPGQDLSTSEYDVENIRIPPTTFSLLNPSAAGDLDFTVKLCSPGPPGNLSVSFAFLENEGNGSLPSMSPTQATTTIHRVIEAGDTKPAILAFNIRFNSLVVNDTDPAEPATTQHLCFNITAEASEVSKNNSILSLVKVPPRLLFVHFNPVADCPVGWFSPSGTNSRGCFECTEGTHGNNSVGLKECHTCPLGLPRSLPGALNASFCFAARGTFKINETDSEKCPRGAVCSVEGLDVQSLQILNGFWRPQVRSLNILECQQKHFCLPGNGLHCLDNHGSALCHSCISSSTERLAKRGDAGNEHCVLCTAELTANDDEALKRRGAAFAIVFVVVLVLVSCRVCFGRMSKTIAEPRARLNPCDWIMTIVFDPFIYTSLKQSVAFLQSIAGLNYVAGYAQRAPMAVRGFFDRFVAVFGLDAMKFFLYGCIPFENNAFTWLQVAAIVPAVGLCINFLMFLIVFGLYSCSCFRKKTSPQQDECNGRAATTAPSPWFPAYSHKQRLACHAFSTMALWVVFVVYPIVSAAALSMFVCVDLGPGEGSYLVADPTINCSSAIYQDTYRPAAIAVVAMYGVFIPVFLLFLLLVLSTETDRVERNRGHDLRTRACRCSRRRQPIKDSSTSSHLPQQRSTLSDVLPFLPRTRADLPINMHFLWAPYRRLFFFYDVLDYIRKFLETGVVLLAGQKRRDRLVFQIAIGFLFIAIFKSFSPFTHQGTRFVYDFYLQVFLWSSIVLWLRTYYPDLDTNVFGDPEMLDAIVAFLELGAFVFVMMLMFFRGIYLYCSRNRKIKPSNRPTLELLANEVDHNGNGGRTNEPNEGPAQVTDKDQKMIVVAGKEETGKTKGDLRVKLQSKQATHGIDFTAKLWRIILKRFDGFFEGFVDRITSPEELLLAEDCRILGMEYGEQKLQGILEQWGNELEQALLKTPLSPPSSAESPVAGQEEHKQPPEKESPEGVQSKPIPADASPVGAQPDGNSSRGSSSGPTQMLPDNSSVLGAVTTQQSDASVVVNNDSKGKGDSESFPAQSESQPTLPQPSVTTMKQPTGEEIELATPSGCCGGIRSCWASDQDEDPTSVWKWQELSSGGTTADRLKLLEILVQELENLNQQEIRRVREPLEKAQLAIKAIANEFAIKLGSYSKSAPPQRFLLRQMPVGSSATLSGGSGSFAEMVHASQVQVNGKDPLLKNDGIATEYQGENEDLSKAENSPKDIAVEKNDSVDIARGMNGEAALSFEKIAKAGASNPDTARETKKVDGLQNTSAQVPGNIIAKVERDQSSEDGTSKIADDDGEEEASSDGEGPNEAASSDGVGPNEAASSDSVGPNEAASSHGEGPNAQIHDTEQKRGEQPNAQKTTGPNRKRTHAEAKKEQDNRSDDDMEDGSKQRDSAGEEEINDSEQ